MDRHHWKMVGSLFTVPLLVFLILGIASGCDSPPSDSPAYPDQAIPGSDPSAGKVAITEYGCASCHVIPGVPGANGTVGPPLTNFAQRQYVAGLLPNEPDNLMRWIRDPQGVIKGVAMPNMAVSEQDAKNIAAYLYTLK
jgi:cytochrome c